MNPELTIKDLAEHRDMCFVLLREQGFGPIDAWNESCDLQRRFARTFGEVLNEIH